MSIKGFARINSFSPDTVNTGMVILVIGFTGLDPSIPASGSTNVSNVDPGSTSAFIGNLIEQTVQGILTGDGYTFGTGDYVRLIGGV